MGKPHRGIPKDLNAGTTDKENKGKDQGPLKEEHPVNPPQDPEPIKES